MQPVCLVASVLLHLNCVSAFLSIFLTVFWKMRQVNDDQFRNKINLQRDSPLRIVPESFGLKYSLIFFRHVVIAKPGISICDCIEKSPENGISNNFHGVLYQWIL